MKSTKKTNSILLGLCLLLAMPLAMADTFDAAQVETLRKQGKAQQAYDLALKFRDELEGDAVYDFYYGLAAMDAGKLSEAVLALERVVLTTPGHTRARLGLARGYFLLKEDTRARQEFEAVLATKPPLNVANNIKKFLRIIRLRESRYRSAGGAYIEVAFGHDTNINSAPADATFFSPLFGTLTLSGGGLEESDDYLTVTTGGKLTHPFEPGKQLIMGVDVSARFNSTEESFDTEAWTAYIGVKWRVADMSYRVTGTVQEFEVNDIDNRSLISLSGEITKRIDKQTTWGTQLYVAQLAYPGQSIRDSTIYILGTGIRHEYAMKWRPTVSAGLYLGIEDAHTDSEPARAIAQRDFAGVRMSVQIIPSSKMSFTASASVENNHYKGESTFTGITRNGDLYQASLTSRYIVDDNWSLGAGVYYTRNDSNTVLNDYDRTRTEVSVRYTF